MDEKIIDISEKAASLSVRLSQLRIRTDAGESSVPIEELAALIVSHPAVCYTHAVLSEIASAGGAVLVCDKKRLPIGMLLPLVGHSTQSERFAAQAEASLPTKKQLWRQIVRAKIMAQARTLVDAGCSESGLVQLARRVRSGDPDNLEAQAARRYWPELLGPTFQRVPGADDPINRLLNYGYAVLRGIVGRALCGAGLHPSLGIHHHNRYNAFCLADDLIEPFRPLVDREVIRILAQNGPEPPLDPQTKGALIGALMKARVKMSSEERSIFDACSRIAASLASVYEGKTRRLTLPSW